MKLNKNAKKAMLDKDFEEFSKSKYYPSFVICVLCLLGTLFVGIICGIYELIKLF